MELLTAVAIVGITAAFAVPQYQKTMERSYYRAAQDILQAIYTGERMYYSRQQNPTTAAYLALGSGALVNWGPIFMDNPNISSPLPVRFTVDVVGVGAVATFTATATGISGRCYNKFQWIRQDRQVGGDWSAPGDC